MANTQTVGVRTNIHDITEQLRKLQLKAKSLASEQIQELEDALGSVAKLAETIAEGGEPFPVGVRELCRTVAEQATIQGKTIQVIMHRTASPPELRKRNGVVAAPPAPLRNGAKASAPASKSKATDAEPTAII